MLLLRRNINIFGYLSWFLAAGFRLFGMVDMFDPVALWGFRFAIESMDDGKDDYDMCI